MSSAKCKESLELGANILKSLETLDLSESMDGKTNFKLNLENVKNINYLNFDTEYKPSYKNNFVPRI